MTASPLPDSRSSLTKFIWLKTHYDLLKSINNDTTIEELRTSFDPNVVATARKRYLIEEDGLVRRDKLVDLIHEEGIFTLRVKMIMYFLSLFRDAIRQSYKGSNFGYHSSGIRFVHAIHAAVTAAFLSRKSRIDRRALFSAVLS